MSVILGTQSEGGPLLQLCLQGELSLSRVFCTAGTLQISLFYECRFRASSVVVVVPTVGVVLSWCCIHIKLPGEPS